MRPFGEEVAAMSGRDVSIEVVVRDGDEVKYEHTVHASNLNDARRDMESLLSRFYEQDVPREDSR